MTSYSTFGRCTTMRFFHQRDKSIPTDELTIKKLDNYRLAKKVREALSNAPYSDLVVDYKRRLIFDSSPGVSVILSPVSDGVNSAGNSHVAGTMKETRGIGWAVTVKSEELRNAKKLAKELSALISQEVAEQANGLWNAVEDGLVREMDRILDYPLPTTSINGQHAEDIWRR